MKYNIVNISQDYIQHYNSCFAQNGSPRQEKNVRWQFLDNPVNKQLVNIAIDDENQKVAAIYAIFPVQFKIGKETYLGSQSLDTITDEDYRGQGLFINLAKDVYEKAVKENVKLVYGFPNGNSIGGFERKLDWQVLDPVPFLIKPLGTGYFTKKIKQLSWLPNIKIAFQSRLDSNLDIQIQNGFPDQVDAIWEEFSKNILVSVKRSKEYLEWRYLQKPYEDYKIAHAYKKNGDYIGYIIYCVKEKHGGKIAYVMEYVYNPKFTKEAKNLLKFATNQIIKEKADCILSWCLEHSENYPHFKSNSFYTLPEKLRPIELHFGVRSFDDKLKELISNRKNWYLSYSDSDTV